MHEHADKRVVIPGSGLLARIASRLRARKRAETVADILDLARQAPEKADAIYSSSCAMSSEEAARAAERLVRRQQEECAEEADTSG